MTFDFPRSLVTLSAVLFGTFSPTARAQTQPSSQGVVALESLDLSRIRTDYGEVRRNLSIEGKPLSIGGQVFKSGLGVHARSRAWIALDGQATRFSARVGVDDEVKGQPATLEFRVFANGKVAWKSGIMRAGDAAKTVDVPLQGVKLLILEVNDGGDGMNFDHADWADANISFRGQAPRLARDPNEIWLETATAAMVFEVGDDKRLYQSYFGRRDASPSHSTDINDEAMPPYGERQIFDTALRVMHADGNTSLALQVVGKSSQVLDSNVTLSKIELKDPNYPFFVTLCFKSYRAQDIIEAWTEIRHQEAKPVTLYQFASSAPNFGRDTYTLTQFHGDSVREMMSPEAETLRFGSKTLASRLGVHAHQFQNPSFLLSKGTAEAGEESGEVIGGSLAYSGNFAFDFEVDHRNRLRAICGMNPDASQYRLSPRQIFVTPTMIWGWSGTGRGALSRQFHRWARQYALRDGDKARAVLLNNWEATYFGFDEKKLVSLFDGAKDLGMELFLLDDGWFGTKYPRNDDTQGLGDWSVDAHKLPHGLSFLTAEAQKRGLRFGIWLEPEMVNPRSELFEKHPDWAIRQPGRALNLLRNQLVLDLTRPTVKEYVWHIIDETLTKNPGISYVKWDCNRYVTQPGSTFLGSDKQSHLWIDYNRALYEIMERMAKKHPKVEVMMCAGGGGRVDYGSLRYSHEFWPSDNTDPLDRIFIQWGYSQFFPALTISSHVTRGPIKFAFDVSMSERLGMDFDLSRYSPEERQFARQAIATYKTIRDVVQFGDLYRLESPYQTPRSSLLYVASDQRHAVFFALQTKPGAATALTLRGLNENTRYLVREINLGEGQTSSLTLHGQVVDGASLMKSGLTPPTGQARDSCIVELIAQ